MEGRSFLMRIYKSKAIACALSLAMAISMTLPIGAFAAVDDSDQTQHEQKAVDIGNGKADGIYMVSTSEELVSAQEAIAAAEGTEATIVLKADVTVSAGGGVISKQLWR